MTDAIDADESHYSQLWIHRSMLSDHVRCETFRQALRECVTPDSVVLDMGAGTGILSLFAAQAGARKVYAIERTSIANLARQLISVNGAEERVEVIHEEMEAVELPEKADVIVSEWLGGYGVDENLLVPVLAARDKWLKPHGKILPERVSAWTAPAWDSELDKDMSFWRNRPYDVDLSLIADNTVNEVEWGRDHITENELLAEPQQMWLTDVYTCSPEEARSPFQASLSFTVTKAGQFNVLATWFRADFGNGIVLTNAPDAPKTHWGRFVFPLDHTIKLEEGEIISVEFVCKPTGVSHCHNKWSVRIGDGVWEQHEGDV